MDQLVTTKRERFWAPEAYARDCWIQRHAAQLPPGSWVLDAGAGASKYRTFFQHCRYQTQDFCQYEGALVQYRQKIDYVCDIVQIPLSDGVLDAIVCTEVIEHVTDPPAAIAEFSRLLKPGGKLLLTAPLLSHLHMEPYHFFGGFTHFWYRHWLPKMGFSIESIEAVGGPGRSCVIFSQSFYNAWAAAEKRSGGIRRLLSRTFRAATKPAVHWFLPRLLPRMDGWLGNETICSGYMVAAVREDSPPPSPIRCGS